MKLKLILSILLWSCLNATAQPYLLHQGNNEALYVLNVTNKQYVVLTWDVFGTLAGYALENDSLVCYFEVRGKLQTRKFKCPFGPMQSYARKLSPDYETKHSGSRVFDHENYRLVISGCEDALAMYKDRKLLWGKDCPFDTNKTHYLTGYIYPQISPVDDVILFEMKSTHMKRPERSRVVEVAMLTGNVHTLFKGREPWYSPDGRYILFKDQHYDRFNVYDKLEKKNITDYSFYRAYWLYR